MKNNFVLIIFLSLLIIPPGFAQQTPSSPVSNTNVSQAMDAFSYIGRILDHGMAAMSRHSGATVEAGVGAYGAVVGYRLYSVGRTAGQIADLADTAIAAAERVAANNQAARAVAQMSLLHRMWTAVGARIPLIRFVQSLITRFGTNLRIIGFCTGGGALVITTDGVLQIVFDMDESPLIHYGVRPIIELASQISRAVFLPRIVSDGTLTSYYAREGFNDFLRLTPTQAQFYFELDPNLRDTVATIAGILQTQMADVAVPSNETPDNVSDPIPAT